LGYAGLKEGAMAAVGEQPPQRKESAMGRVVKPTADVESTAPGKEEKVITPLGYSR
jgi:hypothetical protein